jgi:hypothetical protein
MSTKNSVYGKCRSKNRFLSINAKKDVVNTIGVIAATNRLKNYEVIELGIRAKFPEYFGNQSLNSFKLDNQK